MLVSELIKKLETLPQDRSVYCQVVGKDTGAWAMEFDIKTVESSDWMVALTVSHPNLKNLPMDDFK